ncbi:MAG: head GIN domain-containing protein [Bacteroidota bacterium]
MNCFQATGTTIKKEVNTAPFSKILVNEEIILILKQGDKQSIVIETGENLLNNIEVDVVDEQLILNNINSCNFVREYELTKIYVTTPNLTELRCSTNRYIQSDGVLTFPDLTILSEDWKNDDFLNTGDITLNLDSEKVTVVANGISIFKIQGRSKKLNIVFAANDCRFEGENFKVDEIQVSHKSSNDIIVYPIGSLKGNIYSVGDVIAKKHPEIVEVKEHYKGKLIFD